jgi:peptide/nickel transport system substrate-binding protein
MNFFQSRLLLLVPLLMLTSCKKQIQTNLPSDDKSPADGDIYVAASLGDASYLNPILSTDSASGSINVLIYNGLVKYDKDLKLTGDLAESWEVSADGLIITFHLRKNVKWHDGEPFSAEDVKFTYEKLIDPSVKTPYGADYLLVKKLEVLGPYTVRVSYKEPFAPALESWGMGIIPKHIFSSGDFNTHPANRAPIGTGPFKFSEWKSDEKIVLDANPDYFEGRPHINKYIYRIIPDDAVQFLELRKQSIDEMGLTPDQWGAYPEFFKAYNKFEYPSFRYYYLGFNLNKYPFSDIKFRQAIAYGINKKELIDGVLLGMGKTATGPFPPQSWANDPAVTDYEYDPAKAKELLSQLGLLKDNKPFEFTLMTNQGNKLRSLTAEIIQAQLKKIGVKVNIRIIEWSAFIHQFIDKRNFDAVILGWSLGKDPDQYTIWNSNQVKEGQYNFVGYKNPEVDRLLEKGRKTFELAERRKIYHAIHRLLHDDLAYVFLYYPEDLPVVHKRFIGPEVAPAGIGWNFFKWWVPKQQQKYKISAE